MKNFHLDLVVQHTGGEIPVRFDVNTLATAMYCGRHTDAAALREEMAAALPVPVREMNLPSIPEQFPSFCKCSRYLLTDDNEIEVQGTQTCGEAEVIAFVQGEEIFIGVGSDHCDRTIEPFSYYKPKQMCPRVVGTRVWRYADVADHWDDLQLSSSMIVEGQAVPFQKGTLSTLIPLPELLAKSSFDRNGLVLYCGTVPIEEYVYGEGFSLKLNDPVLGRTLEHRYSVRVLNSRP